MKGAVLAGGLATRLYPLTFATNKHLLPVFDKPMVFYPIQTLVKAGITEVIVVTSGPHAGHFIRVLRNGEDLGLKNLQYAYQENPKGGIADALSLCKDFAEGEPLTVILGDNTTDEDISGAIKDFKDGAVVFLKKVPDPERFGVPVFDKNVPQKIIKIEEKPSKPANNFSVTGLYIYDNKVFDYIDQCSPGFAGRGELEITEVNNFYIKAGKLRWREIKGYWRDAGTFQTLFEANKYWATKVKS
jgi:glucose-1-phosphate thymidylyltransferase